MKIKTMTKKGIEKLQHNITLEMIMETIKNPEKMNKKCDEHLFYLKSFNGKSLIVYAEKINDNEAITICSDWLVKI